MGRLWRVYLSLWGTLKGKRLFFFYALHYTALFFVLWHFSHTAFAGKNFIWRLGLAGDGLSQHFPRLAAISQMAREGFPLYDFHSGLAAQDLQIGFPQILAALFPWEGLETFYNLHVILLYYLAGLSFSILGFFFRQRPLPVLLGAVNYAFCGFALFAGVRHPYFLTPMVFLPLLIIGAEQIMRKEKGWLMLATVFLSLTTQWGLYFSCMQAVLVALYVLVRFFDLYQADRPRQFARVLGRLCLWGGTGALLAAFVAVPAWLAVAGIGRIGRNIFSYTNPFHYPRVYYGNFLTFFAVSPKWVGFWTLLGFSALSVPAVLLLFLERRGRTLQGLFLLLTLMLWIPAAAYVMSGFSNLSNRFCYGYALCVSAILTFEAPHFVDLRRGTVFRLGALLALYGLACCVPPLYFAWFRPQIDSQSAPVGMAFVLLAVFLLLLWRGRKILLPACLAITCFSVCYSAYLLYDPAQGDYASEFGGDIYQAIKGGQYHSLSQTPQVAEDKGFYRVAISNPGPADLGLAFHYGFNGVALFPYFGYSAAWTDWLNEMELSRQANNHLFTGLDIRAPLLTLAGLKYYALRGPSPAPYGFAPIGREGPDVILKNENWLPVGYTYENYISRERYDALSALGKQEAQLQALVLEEPPSLPTLKEADIAATAGQIPCRVTEADGLDWKDGRLEVFREDATMTLSFAGEPGVETYLRVVNLDLTDGANKRIWNMTASTGMASTQARFYSDASIYTHGQHTQTLDLGRGDEGFSTVVLTFPERGTFTLDGLEVWLQPMDRCAAQAAKLGEESLEDIRTNWRSLAGTISVSKDKLLCLAIPWLEGWKAYVDGKEVPLHRANTAFMAVELTAGKHAVELRYWLPGLTVGLALSALGLCCLAGLALRGK